MPATAMETVKALGLLLGPSDAVGGFGGTGPCDDIDMWAPQSESFLSGKVSTVNIMQFQEETAKR